MDELKARKKKHAPQTTEENGENKMEIAKEVEEEEDTTVEQGGEECALFLCFPGNPINVIQKHFIDLVTRAKGPVTIHNPYLIGKKIIKF
jgi:hypothetical protein